MMSQYLSEVRSKRPLVLHVTNYVTVNDCANVCICSGGSPVMSDEVSDIVEMVSSADSLVVNIGTLNDRAWDLVIKSGRAAKDSGVPIVFDPVGAGFTRYRDLKAMRFIDNIRPDVIKGNCGEIASLTGAKDAVKGVDSVSDASDMEERVREMAESKGCIVAATGRTDFVSDGKKTYSLSNGSKMQELVSGAGCMLASVLGTYVGASGASVDSVVAGITAFNVSAEHAERISNGPGTFKANLFDSLYLLKAEELDSESEFKAC